MIRAAVDTNVFISSFFSGNPRKIVNLWKSGEILLCLSDPIIDEYAAVFYRMGLQNEEKLEELLSLFARGFHTLFTAKTFKLDIIEKDSDDNKLIGCAVALQSEFIFREIRHYRK